MALSAPGPIQAGEPATLHFTVSRDGEPVTDLAPYLGAAAHVAIISEDAADFAHTHGEAVEAAHVDDADEHADRAEPETPDEAHAVPTTFGPAIEAEHTFPVPGTYKLWIQVNHDGQVTTAPFSVDVPAVEDEIVPQG